MVNSITFEIVLDRIACNFDTFCMWNTDTECMEVHGHKSYLDGNNQKSVLTGYMAYI